MRSRACSGLGKWLAAATIVVATCLAGASGCGWAEPAAQPDAGRSGAYGSPLQSLASDVAGSRSDRRLAQAGSPGASAGAIDPRSFGADATGAADSTNAIQEAVDAAAAAKSQVRFACGAYLVSAKIKLPSHSDVGGAGRCTTLVAATKFAPDLEWTAATHEAGLSGTKYTIFTNSDFMRGNSNIKLQDISFDMSAFNVAHPKAASSNVSFVNVSNVNVARIATWRGQDGIFFIRSRNFSVKESTLRGHINAALDSWDGDAHYEYSSNTVDGVGAIAPETGAAVNGNYGILVTGISSTNDPATTTGARILNNSLSNLAASGVWIQGGYNSRAETYGRVTDFLVRGNHISNVTQYYGIRVSEAAHGTIGDNVISTTNLSCIAVIGEGGTGASQQDISIDDNTCDNTGAAGGVPAIVLDRDSTNLSISGNRVIGSTHTYAVQAARGATVTVGANQFDRGTEGVLGLPDGSR